MQREFVVGVVLIRRVFNFDHVSLNVALKQQSRVVDLFVALGTLEPAKQRKKPQLRQLCMIQFSGRKETSYL